MTETNPATGILGGRWRADPDSLAVGGTAANADLDATDGGEPVTVYEVILAPVEQTDVYRVGSR